MKTHLYFNMLFMDTKFYNINGCIVVNKLIRSEVRFIATEDLRHIETWLLCYRRDHRIIVSLVPRKGNSKSLNKTFLKVFCNEK